MPLLSQLTAHQILSILTGDRERLTVIQNETQSIASCAVLQSHMRMGPPLQAPAGSTGPSEPVTVVPRRDAGRLATEAGVVSGSAPQSAGLAAPAESTVQLQILGSVRGHVVAGGGEYEAGDPVE